MFRFVTCVGLTLGAQLCRKVAVSLVRGVKHVDSSRTTRKVRLTVRSNDSKNGPGVLECLVVEPARQALPTQKVAGVS